jgi:hypothetical protein
MSFWELMSIGAALLLLEYLFKIFKPELKPLTLSIYPPGVLNLHGTMEEVVLDTLKKDLIEPYVIKLGWILVVPLLLMLSPESDLIIFPCCLIFK